MVLEKKIFEEIFSAKKVFFQIFFDFFKIFKNFDFFKNFQIFNFFENFKKFFENFQIQEKIVVFI